jgi:menaquinone-dependent protoporphyrinogen oxidase
VSRILVVYGTTYGQTERIARRIGRGLAQAGHDPRLERGERVDVAALDTCDAVVVAASVLFGRHQPYIVDLVRRHADRLNALPTAFVSVCANADSADASRRTEARGYVDALLHRTGWRPVDTRSVAGAIAYTRYNLLLRWVMKRICRRSGLPTDTSRDHELTDWSAVDAFARDFAGRLAPLPRAEPTAAG